MMRWLVNTCMQFRLLVIVAAGVIMFFGVRQLRDTHIDMLPEFSQPYVEIQTEALGLSAAEVEALITTPLEADMLSGMPWSKEIRSESIPGLSSIVIVFKPGTDILAARQMVQERLVSVHALPQVSKPPTMINPKSSTARIMNVGLSSEELSQVEMSVLARWTIRPRLMGIPGVANVSIWGQRKRQLQVLVDPETLKEKDVTLQQVIRTTGNALWVSSLSFLDASTPGTGGWIETPNQRLGIRHMLPISTPDDLAQVAVEGTDLRLSDVAQVVETHQPLIGDAIVNDQSNLMLVIEKFPEANTVQVTNDVEKALDALSLGLKGLEMDRTLYRPAKYIASARTSISWVLWPGCFLVIAGLIALLQNWRVALISILSIAVSLLTALLALQLMGASINMLLIAGFAIALLVIIDETTVGVDNICRHLRSRQPDQSATDIVQGAALEIAKSTLYALVIVGLLVAPLFFMNGVYGAFFQAIVLPYIIALVVSMIVALCITPVFCLHQLSEDRAGDQPRSSQWVQQAFDKFCSPVVASAGRGFAALCVILVIGLLAASRLKRDDLLPTFKEHDVAIHLDAPPGTSHTAMARIVSGASKDLRAIPGVLDVCAHVGRAEMSDEICNINSTELWVSIDPGADHDRTMQEIQEVVDGYPGLERDVMSYSQESIQDVLDDEPTEVTVRVYGDDFQTLRQKAEQVAAMMDRVYAIHDVEVHHPEQEPALEIEVDLEKAKEYGLKPGDVRRAATALLSGIEVGSLFEEQKVFDVVVWGVPEIRSSVTSVRELLLDTPTGKHVALAEVANVRFAKSETVIHRDTVARYIDVTAQVFGSDYPTIAADINRGISKIDFPLEYRAELLDGYANHLAAKNRVTSLAITSVVIIFLLLQVAFGSWRLAMAVLLTIPVALIGGVLAVWVTGGTVTLGSLIGFLAVLVIAIRNVILLISRYQYLERYEGMAFGAYLILRGTRERAGPIVTTTLLAVLAILPILFRGNIAGMELLYPMSIVILGSLITTILYSLFGIPATYAKFGEGSADMATERIPAVEIPPADGSPKIQPAT